MRRSSTPLWVLLLLLAGVTAFLLWRSPAPEVNPPEALAESTSAAGTVKTQPSPAPQTATRAPSAEPENLDPARYRRAYVLSLDAGKLGLESVSDIEGDFGKLRGKPEEWSGMLRCSLVSAEGSVLAEELLTAPDHVCRVLDGQQASGTPVAYSRPGPVLFQLRLPRVPQAVRLDVARITGPGSLAHDQPVGSISLSNP